MPNERRIAILGNMNNGGFAIMRYFRDLGADAYLLPYSTDGARNLSHFDPEADTWLIERWRPYIRKFDIPNVPASALGWPIGATKSPSRKEIEAALADYKFIVGSGIAPALLERIGRHLDIFFPYSIGIEFYDNVEFRTRMKSSFLHKFFYKRLRRLQASGIRRTKHCLNAEMSVTRESFEQIGAPFQRLALPAYYNRETATLAVPSSQLRKVVERIRSAKLSVFACARLLWKRGPHYSVEEWKHLTKNSDWLFHGYAELVRARPRARCLLTVVEYGPDVDASKALARELGIEDRILWLPKMARREIMLLLKASDVGVGEFYVDPGVLWGGTGWEVLAAGRPLLQSLNFTPYEFETEFGHPPPPVLDVKSPMDIGAHLIRLYDMPEEGKAMGDASLKWFDENNGIGLARRWLSLLSK